MPDGQPADGGDDDCDATDEDCITRKKELKAFKIMGIQAWMRAFNGPVNIVSFLPQAIAWVRAKKGHPVAAERFVWFTKWWSQIAGWVTSLGTMYLAIDWLLLEADFDRHLLLSPKVSKKKKGKGDDDWEEAVYGALGVIIISIEVAAWVMYYFSYSSALKYGESLVQELAGTEVETTNGI